MTNEELWDIWAKQRPPVVAAKYVRLTFEPWLFLDFPWCAAAYGFTSIPWLF